MNSKDRNNVYIFEHIVESFWIFPSDFPYNLRDYVDQIDIDTRKTQFNVVLLIVALYLSWKIHNCVYNIYKIQSVKG